MDPIWTQLPNDLCAQVFEHLDSATRRDLGMKPRRLTELPRLNLRVPLYEGDMSSVRFVCDGVDVCIIRTPDVLVYERCRRVPFMNVNGIEIFKTENISSITWCDATPSPLCLYD